RRRQPLASHDRVLPSTVACPLVSVPNLAPDPNPWCSTPEDRVIPAVASRWREPTRPWSCKKHHPRSASGRHLERTTRGLLYGPACGSIASQAGRAVIHFPVIVGRVN